MIDQALVEAVDVAVRGRSARPEGGELRFSCPAHDDAHPSAYWNGRKAVWRCAACKAGGGVVDLARRLSVSVNHHYTAREITWTIKDMAGVTIAQHVRQDGPQGKRFLWRRNGTSGLGGLPLEDLPLYGAHELAEAVDHYVVVVEGEKARDSLAARGILAVGTVTGANVTPGSAALEVLTGRDVVLWADHDDPGRRHMDAIARRLVSLRIPPRWFTWPEAPPKGDAADFTGTTDALRKLLEDALEWQPAPAATSVPGVGVLLSTVEREEVEWLWAGRIPRGKVSLLEGDPGEGKTAIALDIAARLTTGRAMPFDSTQREPAGAVYLTAEDGLGDTLRPRLEAAGADLGRILSFEFDKLPEIPGELQEIEAAIARVGAGLVVIDPLNAFLSDRIESHKDHHIRRALAPLHGLAARTGAAILINGHLNKSAGANAKQRGNGSIGYVAAARSALLACPDPENPDRKVLAPVKHNLCATPAALAYVLEPVGGTIRVSWIEETGHSANGLLAAMAAHEEGDESKVVEAKEFLREMLAGGRQPAKDMQRKAADVGIKERTLYRARAELGVRPVSDRGADDRRVVAWYWELPRSALGPVDCGEKRG